MKIFDIDAIVTEHMRSSSPLEPLTPDEEEEPLYEAVTETVIHDKIEKEENSKQETEVYIKCNIFSCYLLIPYLNNIDHVYTL